MPRLIDLSRMMDPANRELMPPEFEFLKTIIAPEIEYLTPGGKGLDRALNAFGCSPEDLPDSEGWGEEWMHSMNTHCGTHVDAPFHSGNQIEGKPARTISDIGLDELYRPGMVLDLRESVQPEAGITVAALEAAIAATGKDVEPGDAVMLRTGQERYTMADREFFQYPGMTGEGTRYLTSLGATILGTDAFAWDRPFPAMRKAFEESGDKSHLWDGHFAIRDREAFIVQQMSNLGALPPHGFMVGFFPLSLPKTSASPARVVAFLPN